MSDDSVERARAVRIEDVIEARGIRLRGRVDRIGACPVCGGRDRFFVEIKRQAFNCRNCGVDGDVIRLVQFLDGCDFRAAVTKLVSGGDKPSDALARDDRRLPPSGRGAKQADILIELAQAAELFHTLEGTGFADLDINGHRATWPIRSKGFRRWLARRFLETTEGAPSSEALQSALKVIEATAHFDAPERVVHVRVGGLDDKLYLDLCDETWRAVEIDAAGWRVISNPPVRFRRAPGMLPLPAPVCGGDGRTAAEDVVNSKGVNDD